MRMLVSQKKKAMKYHLQKKKDEMIEGGDIQALLNYLKRGQGEDPCFFIQCKLISIIT